MTDSKKIRLLEEIIASTPDAHEIKVIQIVDCFVFDESRNSFKSDVRAEVSLQDLLEGLKSKQPGLMKYFGVTANFKELYRQLLKGKVKPIRFSHMFKDTQEKYYEMWKAEFPNENFEEWFANQRIKLKTNRNVLYSKYIYPYYLMQLTNSYV